MNSPSDALIQMPPGMELSTLLRMPLDRLVAALVVAAIQRGTSCDNAVAMRQQFATGFLAGAAWELRITIPPDVARAGKVET